MRLNPVCCNDVVEKRNVPRFTYFIQRANICQKMKRDPSPFHLCISLFDYAIMSAEVMK